MSGVTLASIEKALKEYYAPGLNAQLATNIYLAQRFDTVEKFQIRGKHLVVGLAKTRGGSTKSFAEGQTLPEAGSPGVENVFYLLADHAGGVEITGQALRQSKGDMAAFIDGVTLQVNSVKDELMLDANRQLYDNGSGVLATVVSAAVVDGNTVITVDSAENMLRGHLFINRPLDAGSFATPTAGFSGLRILDVDPDTPSVTVSGDVTGTVAADQYLFAAGNRTDGSVSNEMVGIKGLIDDTTIVGELDPTAAGNGYWKSIIDADGGTPTLARLKRLQNLMIRAGGKADECITTAKVQDDLYDQISSEVRVPQQDTIEGGYVNIRANGLSITADPSAPFGELFLPNFSDIKHYSDEPWHWLEGFADPGTGQGSIFIRPADKWSYVATYHRSQALGASRRNRSARMTGLTDTEGV